VKRVTENRGIAATFETLLRCVTAPFFALADQDDVWRKDKLEVQLGCLIREKAAIVFSDVEVVDEKLNTLKSSMRQYAGYKPMAGAGPIAYLVKNSVTGCTVVGDSRMLLHALPFPKSVKTHDWWLAAIAARYGGLVFEQTATVKYRQHGANDTGAHRRGLYGLCRRLKAKGLTFSEYLIYRHERRWNLAVEYHRRFPGDSVGEYVGLIGENQSNGFKNSANYWRCLRKNAHQLGLRTIAIEVFMEAITRFALPLKRVARK